MSDLQSVPSQTLIFTYGTLKQDFPNYHLMLDLIRRNDAVHLGTYVTHQPYPLVIGPNGIPFLINLPAGGGFQVKGELYSVSAVGLVRVDDLEGTTRGHYDRLPIQLERQEEGDSGAVVTEAEAYFANPSFGERMWEKSGRVGLSEYSVRDAENYVKIENRPKGSSFLDHVSAFLNHPFSYADSNQCSSVAF